MAQRNLLGYIFFYFNTRKFPCKVCLGNGPGPMDPPSKMCLGFVLEEASRPRQKQCPHSFFLNLKKVFSQFLENVP